MAYLGLVLGIVSIFPIVGGGYHILVARLAARRLLRLRRRGSVDIVVTTSDQTRSAYGAASAQRALAPEGEVQAVGGVASTLGRWYPRLRLNIQVSNRLARELARDLVVLGGPAGNHISRQLLEELSSTMTAPLSIDAGNCALQVGSYVASAYDLCKEHDIPNRDLGVVVVGMNPLASNHRRLIICAGFTTYGTGAAADFFFSSMTNRRRLPRLLRQALHGSQAVGLVVEARFTNGYMSGCQLRHWERLPAK